MSALINCSLIVFSGHLQTENYRVVTFSGLGLGLGVAIGVGKRPDEQKQGRGIGVGVDAEIAFGKIERSR